MSDDITLKNKDTQKPRKTVKKITLKYLKLSLKYRPDIIKLILKLRHSLRKKNKLIHQLKKELKNNSNHNKHKPKESNAEFDSCEKTPNKSDSSTQTNYSEEKFLQENLANNDKVKEDNNSTAWNIEKSGDSKSIADQVKEVAQNALQQNGMVYVESAGMYYDYKTGYYYNPDLGLYYHTHTNCYYYYSEEKQEFAFHSYPDKSLVQPTGAPVQRAPKKLKKVRKTEDEIDKLSKNLSQDKEDEEVKPKRKKITKKKSKESEQKEENKDKIDVTCDKDKDMDVDETDTTIKNDEVGEGEKELEDGECSDSEESIKSAHEDDDESDASTSTASDDDVVAKHHPPCMRVIVSHTTLPKLKVGSLFLITKDGGTVGREGEQHAILLRDSNVSRIHLDIKYDMEKKMYIITDLGSKNGTVLNGVRISPSQRVSEPAEVVHGSILQLGETKLLCHIHPGNDTCGHCEPGLIMATEEKEKKAAYTRTCSVQKQYQLELARLKNKYAPEPLAIEDGSYNDRAKARRDTVGSSHHSEKTQSNDVDTFIAPENKGFKLLEKMGWSKGEGLGKDNQGDTEPIPLVSNEGKAGLGAASGGVAAAAATPPRSACNTLGPATLRLATRTKMLKPPAKAFQNTLEEDSE